jgi:hypothetical protein
VTVGVEVGWGKVLSQTPQRKERLVQTLSKLSARNMQIGISTKDFSSLFRARAFFLCVLPDTMQPKFEFTQPIFFGRQNGIPFFSAWFKSSAASSNHFENPPFIIYLLFWLDVFLPTFPMKN